MNICMFMYWVYDLQQLILNGLIFIIQKFSTTIPVHETGYLKLNTNDNALCNLI